ncbi:MAG: hypothetical protein P1S60_14270, partial [Anaerolineae bacterium]|nr:hypothetical protein [Anaerolineae bacterium]
FIGGVFCDLLSASPLGLWTLVLTSVGFLAGQPWVQALGPTLIRLAMMSVICTLAGHSLLLITMVLLGYPVDFWYSIQTTAGPASLLNVVLSPFAFTFLVWFHKRSLRITGGFFR